MRGLLACSICSTHRLGSGQFVAGESGKALMIASALNSCFNHKFFSFHPPPLPPHTHTHSHSHSRHYPPRRQLTTPKRSHLVQHSHKPSPGIADHAMPPQRQSEDTLVVYHLDDFPTPYAKRIGGTGITLAEFKEKVFARKGDYR